MSMKNKRLLANGLSKRIVSDSDTGEENAQTKQKGTEGAGRFIQKLHKSFDYMTYPGSTKTVVKLVLALVTLLSGPWNIGAVDSHFVGIQTAYDYQASPYICKSMSSTCYCYCMYFPFCSWLFSIWLPGTLLFCILSPHCTLLNPPSLVFPLSRLSCEFPHYEDLSCI